MESENLFFLGLLAVGIAVLGYGVLALRDEVDRRFDVETFYVDIPTEV